jgi:cytoskeletal protein CcmA (bactofilin family)
MFSKPNKSTSTRSEAEPRKSVPASLIAENVVFHGDMASDGDVHLDGTVLGDVRVGLLTVGETGRVTGSIEAQAVEVRGAVYGTITARSVRLRSTARVEGDITHTQISVDAGAHFVGRSLVYDAPAPVETAALIAPEAPAEVKVEG